MVRGFAYVPGRSPDATNDRLLVDGDEALPEPPDRPVVGASAVRRGGLLPPAKLPAGRIHDAADLDANLPDRVARTLARPDAVWSRVVRTLSAELDDAGHLVWVAGGAVRDLVGGDGDEAVNDLDLTGTAPPGRFTEIARTVRRRKGFAELREKVSPDSLVCSTAPAAGGSRLFEYRPLMLTGFRFPASGSDLEEDARNRDFTINSLYYDTRRDLVLDPTGRALGDVTARPRCLVSVNETRDAVRQAHVLIRGIAFLLRWRDKVRVGEATIPAAAATPGWSERIGPNDWPRLIRAYRKGTKGFAADAQRAAARSLGAAVDELLDELLRRAG